MIIHNELNLEATTSPHTKPELKLIAGGAVELRASAILSATYQPNQPRAPNAGNTATWVEAQALPSEVTLAGITVGRTLCGIVNSNNINEGKTGTVNLDVSVLLTREQVLEVEHARAGRAVALATKLQVVVRSREQANTFPFDLTWRIAASDWLDMLESVGFFRTVQVLLPFPASIEPTKNAHLLSELKKAQRLLHNGDRSSAVAVVRDVWNPIVKEYSPDGKWDTIIAKALPPMMATAVKEYATRLRDLVNKGHHRGIEPSADGSPLYDFTDRDAEFVLQTTLIFLRYLGRLAVE